MIQNCRRLDFVTRKNFGFLLNDVRVDKKSTLARHLKEIIWDIQRIKLEVVTLCNDSLQTCKWESNCDHNIEQIDASKIVSCAEQSQIFWKEICEISLWRFVGQINSVYLKNMISFSCRFKFKVNTKKTMSVNDSFAGEICLSNLEIN